MNFERTVWKDFQPDESKAGAVESVEELAVFDGIL